MNDLPSSTENGRYTQEELVTFDQFREEFKQSVNRLASCDIRDQLTVEAEKRVDSHNNVDTTCCRLTYVLHNNTSMRHLQSVSLHSGCTCIDLIYDLITAIYVPVGLPWLDVDDGKCHEIIARYKGSPDPPLDTILQQAREIPKVAVRSLESLLELTRRYTKYVHAQEDMIIIDGIEYKRWQFCEPYHIYWCRGLGFRVPEKTKIYIECVILDIDAHRKFRQDTDYHILFANHRVIRVHATYGIREFYPPIETDNEMTAMTAMTDNAMGNNAMTAMTDNAMTDNAMPAMTDMTIMPDAYSSISNININSYNY
jgi:hypothetical protein